MQGADLAQPLRCRNDVQMKKDPAALFGVGIRGKATRAYARSGLTI